MRSILISLFLSALLVSCGGHVTVTKVNVDRSSLASTFVKSPDPLQDKPPVGERLYIQWTLPLHHDPQEYHLLLSVIYKNLTEEKKEIPLATRFGTETFSVVDAKFKETDGLYSYKVDLIDQNGHVCETWKHQMWVNLIGEHKP